MRMPGTDGDRAALDLASAEAIGAPAARYTLTP